MATIPQRELRNNISEILRRAESGEHLIVTVDGRPVAQLGPLTGPGRLAPAAALGPILADTPVDARWSGDLRDQRAEDQAAARDPWAL